MAPLLAGAVLGLSVAAPFGPVSLICVQKSLNGGCRQGMAAGFGAATAHGIFATVAIASAGAASALLSPWSASVRVVSAVILIALGIRTILRARSPATRQRSRSLRATYASLVLLALSNPMTIIPYLAVATVAEDAASAETLTFWSIPGITLATATWYGTLVVVTSTLRTATIARFGPYLNVIAGAALILFGAIVGHLFDFAF